MTDTNRRAPLTRERILSAAVDLADQAGLDALTMRRLGSELGVEAMSLYKHIANKEDILDGIVELVIGEIEIPSEGADWREAMTRRATSARKVLGRHSWAVGLFESRNSTGSTVLRYVDSILGSLRSAGFSVSDAAHAFWLLDSYVYGHVVQENSMSLETRNEKTEAVATSAEPPTAEEYPHLAEAQEDALRTGYTFDGEFEFGLNLILDGLEKLRSSVPTDDA